MEDLPPKVNLLIRRALAVLEELHRGIQEHTESIHAAEEAQRRNNLKREPIHTIVSYDDQTVRDTEKQQNRQNSTQGSIKNWTRNAVIAACIYSAIAAYQGYEMRQSTIAAQRSADAANKAADAAIISIRPWVKIESVELRPSIGPIKTLMFHWPLTENIVPPMIQVKFSVANLGHSVAQNVQVVPELFFGRFESDKWHEVVTQEEERYCQSVANQLPTGASKIVFPSESTDWYMGVGGTVPESDTAHPLAVSSIACVDYTGAPTTRYQSQAWFGLYENNSVFINTGLDADLRILKLIRDESGNHAN